MKKRLPGKHRRSLFAFCLISLYPPISGEKFFAPTSKRYSVFGIRYKEKMVFVALFSIWRKRPKGQKGPKTALLPSCLPAIFTQHSLLSTKNQELSTKNPYSLPTPVEQKRATPYSCARSALLPCLLVTCHHKKKRQCVTDAFFLYGWGGRIRTCECRLQRAMPYHLATPQSLHE